MQQTREMLKNIDQQGDFASLAMSRNEFYPNRGEVQMGDRIERQRSNEGISHFPDQDRRQQGSVFNQENASQIGSEPVKTRETQQMS